MILPSPDVAFASSEAVRAAALWSGLLILLLIGLSGLVVRQRRRHRIGHGDGGQPELATASRAFGNAAEYVPAGFAALILMALVGVPAAIVHAIGAALLLGRVIHAGGISRSLGVSWGRMVGMALTWIPLLLAAVVLLAYAVA